MITIVLASVLSSCLQEPEPAAAPKLSPELTAIRSACAKLAEVPSYTFHHLSREEGAPSGGGRGGRPPAGDGGAPAVDQAPATPPAPVPVEFTAHVQKNQPLHFQQGELEAWRQDSVMVWRTGDGAWQRLDSQSMRGGGRVGAPASDEEWRAMRSRMGLFSAQAAHDLVQGFESKIAMVTSSAEGGKTVYVGSLTPEGAATLTGAARFARGGRGGGLGGAADAPGGGADAAAAAPVLQNSGTFRIVVDANGRIESFTLDTLMSGSFQERAIERKRHVEYRFSAIGETKLEVPAEVTAKFAEKPVEGGLEF
jgi:hypothetical protein